MAHRSVDGFAVFVMLGDHFGGASWIYLNTGNISLFVSHEEAFVFISGSVVGMVLGAEDLPWRSVYLGYW